MPGYIFQIHLIFEDKIRIILQLQLLRARENELRAGADNCKLICR
jgi:hypothetical protein